jgi:hypothetical protein
MASAKQPNKEYVESGATADRPTAEQQEAAGVGENTGTNVGQTADKTYYLDEDGNVSTSEPERGSVLVAEGDTVTESVADKLSGK